VVSAATGLLSDGSATPNYGTNSNCKWLIAPTNAKQVTVSFTEFLTEANYDFVYVSSCADITCANPQQIAKLSGSYLSAQNVISTTGFVLVTFTSDYSVEYPGFLALWTSSTEAAITPPPTAVRNFFFEHFIHAWIFTQTPTVG
jgi:hypothetical protein